MSPALAGGLLMTAPPGKSLLQINILVKYRNFAPVYFLFLNFRPCAILYIINSMIQCLIIASYNLMSLKEKMRRFTVSDILHFFPWIRVIVLISFQHERLPLVFLVRQLC